MLSELRARATSRELSYHAWPNQGWGVELEIGDFLWGLVRAFRPALVLESGTGIGISTRFLGSACKENQHGRVISFEPDPVMLRDARKRVRGLPVEIRDGTTLEWETPRPDFVFLDSFPGEVRRAEISKWLSTGVLLAIHDAGRYELPRGLQFPTPRGFWLGRGPQFPTPREFWLGRGPQ